MAGVAVVGSGNYELFIDTGFMQDAFVLDDATEGVLDNYRICFKWHNKLCWGARWLHKCFSKARQTRSRRSICTRHNEFSQCWTPQAFSILLISKAHIGMKQPRSRV
jgi:hypothetical protein